MPDRYVKPEVALPRMTVNEAHLLLGKTLLPGERLTGIEPVLFTAGIIVRQGYRAVIEGNPTQLGTAKLDEIPTYAGMSS